MAYMKKNVNFGLLALILVIIMIFIGFTLYYQQTFNSLASNYTTKLSQLEKVTRELTKHKSVLTETRTELNRTSVDIEALAEDYGVLVEDNERLEGELADTTSKLNQKVSELKAEKVTTANLKETVAVKDQDIVKWKGLYESEVVKYNEVLDDLDRCDDDLDDCEDELDVCLG